jgi:hypothetical protein
LFELNSRCPVYLTDSGLNSENTDSYATYHENICNRFIALEPFLYAAEEVAHKLMHIFTFKGTPYALQCDNIQKCANEFFPA